MELKHTFDIALSIADQKIITQIIITGENERDVAAKKAIDFVKENLEISIEAIKIEEDED